MTVLGTMSSPSSSRILFCACRFVTINCRRNTSLAGTLTRRRGGTFTGAFIGTTAIADGIIGITDMFRRSRPCLRISVITLATATRAIENTSASCIRGITTIDRVMIDGKRRTNAIAMKDRGMTGRGMKGRAMTLHTRIAMHVDMMVDTMMIDAMFAKRVDSRTPVIRDVSPIETPRPTIEIIDNSIVDATMTDPIMTDA
jgi:hypothetical protein